MKKIVIAMLGLASIFTTLNAQNNKEVAIDPVAKQKLDVASDKFAHINGLSADLSIQIDDNRNNKKSTIKGNLLLKKNKFKLTLPDVVSYYDGKTQYYHLVKENEVNISEPKDEDLKETNPLFLLQAYKSGYKMRFEGTQKSNGKTVDVVNLYPNDRNKPYSIITVKIDKATSMPVSITTKGKNGIDTIVSILSYSEKNIADNSFVFDTKSNSNVEIIDLR